MKVVGFVQQPNGGDRFVVHMDWPRINSRCAHGLEQDLQRLDADAYVIRVYGDGLRCADDAGRPAYWRKPLKSLEEVLETCSRYGVKEVRGFWLLTGALCQGRPEHEGCALGSPVACMPAPGEVPEDMWFTAGEAAR